MPSLILTDGVEEFTWRITGLSAPFTSAGGYLRAGITSSQFTVGGVTSISGVVDSINARSSGTSTTAGPSTVSRYPGTFTFWGWTQTNDGKYWPAGSDTVTVTEYVPPAVRPSNWSWWSAISSGSPIQITANEWNSFCSKINEFRAYVGYDQWSFTPAYRGAPIDAARMNEAHQAIGPMTNAAQPGWRAQGQPITADYFIRMRDFLNSVH